jgi:hypothetical protein
MRRGCEMPKFLRHLPKLNSRFTEENIAELARDLDRFAPGRRFDHALMIESGTPLNRLFEAFLNKLPASFHEAVNAVVRTALSTTPPTPVTFAWAPAYGPELTVLHADCGVTILIKTPYPAED